VSAPAREGVVVPPVSEVERGRRSYRRSRQRRSTWVAVVSTLVFAAVLVVGTTSAPGWERTQQSFLDPAAAQRSLLPVLSGLWLNVRVLLVAAVCVFALGLVVALLRTLRGPVWAPVRLLAAAYTDVFRGVPLLVLLYIIGFGVPGLRLQGVPTDPVVLGTTAIVLTYGAYVAEVFRAGLESVHPSQRAAARALGLTHRQTVRLVVLPQAVRNVLPDLLSNTIEVVKLTSLASVVSLAELLYAANMARSLTYNASPLVAAALLYLLILWPLVRLVSRFQRRLAV